MPVGDESEFISKPRPVKEILVEIALSLPVRLGSNALSETMLFINTDALANTEQEKEIKKMRWNSTRTDDLEFALRILVLNSFRG